MALEKKTWRWEKEAWCSAMLKGAGGNTNINTKFHKNISSGFQSYSADTILLLKYSKGHKSIKNVQGVPILVLCTSSDGIKYLYQVS